MQETLAIGQGCGILSQMPDDLLKQLGSLDQNFLWASCVWGAIASGYCIYGWKQKSWIPLLGGAVMTAMSFIGPNALVMSVVCIGAMYAVHWLIKHGY
jgi:hypothetical protein